MLDDLKLYEIAPQIDNLIRENTDQETGEIDEAIVDQILSLEMHAEQKIHNCGQVLRSYDSMIDSINNEIKKLKANLNKLRTKRENLADYVVNCSSALNIDSVFFEGRRTEIKMSRERVEISDISALEDDYISEVVVRKPDKRAIHEIWRSQGVIPDGARIVRTKVVKV